MAVLKANTTEQNMLKKGFSLAPGDHKWFEFFLEDGTYVTRTKMSHNGQDIGDDLISKMSHQCKVSSSFFKEFAKCKKSKDEYISELKKKKYI
jgi:hypothetical protein